MTYSELLTRNMHIRQARRAVHTARYWRELGNQREARYWAGQAATLRSMLY